MSIWNFDILSELGKGAYSKVYKVQRITDWKMYALKKVDISNQTDKEKANALGEVRLLAGLKSDFIVEYKEAFIDDESGSLCLVMDYAENGDAF